MAGSLLRCPDCSALLDDETRPCPRCGRAPENADGVPAGAAPTALPPLQDAPRYKASGRFNADALPRLLVNGLAGALVIGGLYALITHFFDLFLIFPLLFGLGVGAVVALAVKSGHVRNPLLAGSVALVAGMLAYALAFGIDAYRLRPAMVEGMSQDIADKKGVPLSEAQAYVEKRLDLVTTLKLGAAFMEDTGVSIKHNGVGEGDTISGTGFIVLSVFEALLMGGAAAAIGAGSATERYCETCRVWQQKKTIFATSAARAPEVTQAARMQDWNAIAQIRSQSPPGEKNVCNVFVDRCPDCSDGMVTIKSLLNKVNKQWLQASLPPEGVQRLEQAGYLPAVKRS